MWCAWQIPFHRSTFKLCSRLATDNRSSNRDSKRTFTRQEGYGAFSYGHSQLDTIIRYIQNQEKHHSRRTFRDEYLTLLRKFDIAFKEKYVFEFIE